MMADGQGEKSGKENGMKRSWSPETDQSVPPKNEEDEESCSKKPRDEPPIPPQSGVQSGAFTKSSVWQLKKTGETFLQDKPCFEVAPKLPKCRECRWTTHQRSRNISNIFCRFYAFRKLRYIKNGQQLVTAGFLDPYNDPTPEDLNLWLPLPDSSPPDLDLETSRFLLSQVGDQFCDLLEQEKEAAQIHMSDDKTIAWKKVVQGVREMCDVCDTTLFNFHWACGKCGFVVCIDCYKSRKSGTVKIWGERGKDRDDQSWLLCTNRQGHKQEQLILTQIIAGDSLQKLCQRVHDVRALWDIPMHCGCSVAASAISARPPKGICKELVKNLQVKAEPVNGQMKSEKEEKTDDKKTDVKKTDVKKTDVKKTDVKKTDVKKTDDVKKVDVKKTDGKNTSWFRDFTRPRQEKQNTSWDFDSSSDSDDDKGNRFYATLREKLIKLAPPPTQPPPKRKRSQAESLSEVISNVIELSVNKENNLLVEGAAVVQPKLHYFTRLYNVPQKSHWRQIVPIRIMTMTESKKLYPDLPHSWLCGGRLLWLMDPSHPINHSIFQDQWKRGQPVLVSNVSKTLDIQLWHPDSFIKDFGDTKNDLVNCVTGNLLPNQFMRKFWEGFENTSKRLKDDKGNAMLLKLKDWPPGEDFAEMLPSRFEDLMKALPMGQYTQRTGRLNLASRLPNCFVRPDLGPKMYTAYGSALHPNKGTTNLHLDISDAVNVMVYVGIPKDLDSVDYVQETYRVIDEACPEMHTRRRVREKSEVPGALWHIYAARDADKIRDLLNKVAIERGARLEPHHDPIHDQSWYLDRELRERLYKEYEVKGYTIVQCLGDAIFIPAGAPHQVQNLHNCIKVAEDFVSPENVSHCFHLTQEFRELSDTHSNHEDKLQIKNIIYHAVKDSLTVLCLKENCVSVKSEPTDS